MYNKNVKKTFEILRSEITFLMDLKCIAIVCMLGCQPSGSSQFCFSLEIYSGRLDFTLYDSSDLKSHHYMRGLRSDVVSLVRPTSV